MMGAKLMSISGLAIITRTGVLQGPWVRDEVWGKKMSFFFISAKFQDVLCFI